MLVKCSKNTTIYCMLIIAFKRALVNSVNASEWMKEVFSEGQERGIGAKLENAQKMYKKCIYT